MSNLVEMYEKKYSFGVMAHYFKCTKDLISLKAQSMNLEPRLSKEVIGLDKMGLAESKLQSIKKIFKRHRDYSHNIMEFKRG